MDDHNHDKRRKSKAMTAKKKHEYNGGFTSKHVRIQQDLLINLNNNVKNIVNNVNNNGGNNGNGTGTGGGCESKSKSSTRSVKNKKNRNTSCKYENKAITATY